MRRRLYDLGHQQLQAGNASEAITALRQALALDNGNRSLRFALAGALGEAGDHESARQILLGIRETSPEDPVVNLELARLNAREDNASPEAARYYQSALYGTWTGSDADARRRAVRMELIQFLLSHQQRERALSELLALSTTVPDDPASHNEVGRLFLIAGEPRRGLDQFQRSLQLDAANEAARSGAGEAAFDAGDYAAAIRYLNDAASGSKSHDLRTVAELVIGRDPLRSGLSESAQYVTARRRPPIARANGSMPARTTVRSSPPPTFGSSTRWPLSSRNFRTHCTGRMRPRWRPWKRA